MEYKKGANLFGNLVQWIIIELMNKNNLKIKTGHYEPKEILRLIAFLDNKAKIKNTDLSLDDFRKIKWF